MHLAIAASSISHTSTCKYSVLHNEHCNLPIRMVSMTTLLFPMQLVATMLIVLMTLYGTADNEALVEEVVTSVEPGLMVMV